MIQLKTQLLRHPSFWKVSNLNFHCTIINMIYSGLSLRTDIQTQNSFTQSFTRHNHQFWQLQNETIASKSRLPLVLCTKVYKVQWNLSELEKKEIIFTSLYFFSLELKMSWAVDIHKSSLTWNITVSVF